MSQGTVLYQSTHQGMSHPPSDAGVTYFGITFRVPRSEHSTIRQLEWEASPRELLKSILLPNGRAVKPMTDSPIERIETLDQATGDLLVMYRVPYQVE